VLKALAVNFSRGPAGLPVEVEGAGAVSNSCAPALEVDGEAQGLVEVAELGLAVSGITRYWLLE
jgi:hypothetical protein